MLYKLFPGMREAFNGVIHVRWYYICIHFFYRSHLKSIAKFDEESRQNLIEEGWNNDCYDYEFIVDLYKRFKSYRGKFQKIHLPLNLP